MNSPIYIRFGYWDTIKSKLIRWITDSEWTHVWIEYESNHWNTDLIVHSEKKGVSIESKSSFIERRKEPSKSVKYEIQSTDYDLSNGFKGSSLYLGKDYGYMVLILNCVLLLLWKMGLKFLKPVRDKEKYTCSEFIVLFIKNSNIPCNLDPEHTWPGKLESWIEQHPYWFRKVL